jgi:ABC-2 type transport system ATP-binding protein
LNIIDVTDVTKNYGRHCALNKVNLQIPSQGIFGLLGPNGAGKTSLIRILTQIILPDSGTVLYAGNPLQHKHAALIGYLPEERGLYKKMGVAEQLVYFGRLRNMSKWDARIKVLAWLEKLQLAAWKENIVADLSKGMQQKVQFIAAVLHDPELIILDEPFSGFDPINSEIITEEILELKKKGSTIIFSTHRMETVESLCDSIALIHHGETILNGTLKDIKQKFKKHIFRIEGWGKVMPLPEMFEILSMNSSDNYSIVYLKLKPGYQYNDLLLAIMPHLSICMFREELPSMNDIFILQVNNKTDHE